MPNNFDWQTDEDRRDNPADWEVTQPASGSPPSGRRVRWRLIAIIAVLVAAAGALIWWRVDKRMDENLQAMRTDVASSYNLIQQAVARDDEELFRTVLSGRDKAWTSTQITLFNDGMLIDRAALGLEPAEGSVPASLPLDADELESNEPAASITFSPDLGEAVVVASQPYTTQSDEPVMLRQTTVYRRGGAHWLLSPPLQEFWGDTQARETDRLLVTYPFRDREIVARLSEDLDAAVARLCDTLEDIRCVDQPLPVRFDTDPVTLTRFNDLIGAVQRQEEPAQPVRLPAPTLVGLPVETDEAMAEAGYQALLKAYESRLLAAVVAQSVGWECCQQALVFQVLFEKQLSQLGIQPWPVTDADRQQVLDRRVWLGDLSTLWWDTKPAELPWERRWAAYVATDFLLAAIPGATPASLQRSLTGAGNIGDWLNTRMASAGGENSWVSSSLEQAWWMYALQGKLQPAGEHAPLDGEDLYLACTTLDSGDIQEPSRLLRYGPDAGKWEELYTLDGFIWMSPLPDPQTLLLQEFVLAGETWQTSVWRNGAYETLHQSEGGYSISFGESDPTGEQLVAYMFDANSGGTATTLLDLDACQGGRCQSQTLPGIPSWSPDGTRAIYMVGDIQSMPIVRTNGRVIILASDPTFQAQPLAVGPAGATSESELTPIPDGYSPFWLDDNTYGYIQPIDPFGRGRRSNQALMVNEWGSDEPRPVLTTADLEPLLAEIKTPRDLVLAYVAPHPVDRDLMFVVALDTFSRDAYVFSYDFRSGKTELRLQANYELNHSLGFSPDGRYLVLTGRDRSTTLPGDTDAVLLLHDIAANQTTPFVTRLPFFIASVSYDWTEDSQWLAVAMDDNLVGLIAPAEKAVYPLPHRYGSCTSLAWQTR